MNETHIRELIELEQEKVEIERQKLAIQFAAIEVRIDDKIQLQTKKIIDAVSGMVSGAVTELKAEMARGHYELKNEISGVRSELKADIARLEEKMDNHAH
ncbi:hypothetical protein [Nonomuraea sp. NPDC049480]|uniref:hypothetical protein n=1 Tax=Nonomuraea sp. NPDC049480 TaxID=3364353 RepID=UPI0037BC0B06